MIHQIPLILTLQINESAFAYFNALRTKHFPPQINYLEAHVTLFHHLPAITAVTEWLATAVAQQPIITMEVSGVLKLGRGVAFKLQSAELMHLQAYLKKQWLEWLTPQDYQGFRPHITIQNKVNVETAHALFTELTASFKPFYVQGIGLSLWEYQGGPWHKLKDFPFLTAS